MTAPTKVVSTATVTPASCFGGNGTVTITAIGGTGSYGTSTGSFSVPAGQTYSFIATDSNGCTSNTISGIMTSPTALAASCIASNEALYFGFSGDQMSVFSVSPSGGTGPYTVRISMDRELLCNQINNAGDESWNGGSGSVTTGNTCGVFPSTISSIPVSTKTISSGSYSVTLSLMANANITATITDANGCVTTCTKLITAEDVRCFAGNSNNQKVTICHQTGSTKNPCIKVCVDAEAVAAHLAHGDYVGLCTPTCLPPSTSKMQNLAGGEMTVKVWPNPSNSQFELFVESTSDEKIDIVVYDMLGRIVSSIIVIDSPIVTFGDTLAAGTYLIEVFQGNEKRMLRVIKK